MWNLWQRDINIVERLFDSRIDRINEMKFATMTTSVCLHEAGHIIFAKKYNLTIEKAWIPPVDWFLIRQKATRAYKSPTTAATKRSFAFL